MEEIKDAIMQLTGAVNAQIELTTRLDRRLQILEQEKEEVAVANLQAPATEDDLKEISKLPDAVKELQSFDGNPTRYLSWINNVENILKDYEIVKHKPIYRAILRSIRQKIRGSADTALISYNIYSEDWTQIKRCLSLHYADKRDVRTLEHQLSRMVQKNMNADEFYANVNHQLSLIINKIKTEDYSQETVNVLVESYRNRALDVFIRGLNGDLSKMLMIQKPQTLPEAYASCLEVQNLNFRNMQIHPRNILNTVTAPANQSFTKREQTRLPNFSTQQRIQYQQNQFQPKWTPQTMPQQNIPQQIWLPQANMPQNRPPPLPQKPPVPMDIDRSVQTRQVNYMNRPAIEAGMSRISEPGNFPRKPQRLFNIITQDSEEGSEDEIYDQHSTEGVEYNEPETNEENLELNFMEAASAAFHT